MSDKIDPLTCLCEGNFECPTPDVCPEMFRRENAALRAENARLVNLIAGAEQRAQEAQSANEQKTRDLKDFILVANERDALRAENEQLKAQHANDLHTIDVGSKANAALEIENERLRAALAEITDLELEGDASLADALHIADEALNPPPSQT